ncbi:MAG: hypothetical protein QM784_15130 [Polyangiaceae bacterium]
MIVSGWFRATLAMGLFVGATVVGCSSDDNSDSSSSLDSVDCSTGEIPTFSSLDFSKCTGCHSSTLSGAARDGAPSDINFDVYASAKTHATHAVGELDEGAMPPSSLPKPSQAVVDAIVKWAACGTPE